MTVCSSTIRSSRYTSKLIDLLSCSISLRELTRSVFKRYLDQQLFGPGGEDNRSGGIIGQAITMRDDFFVRGPDGSESYREEHGLGSYAQLRSDPLGAIIFTGGVCNSAYVRRRITEALQTNVDELKYVGIDEVLRGTVFAQPDNGQTCVCRGLVYARIQELKHKEPSLLKTFFGLRKGRGGESFQVLLRARPRQRSRLTSTGRLVAGPST